MAFPTTGVLDSFNRTENPLSDGGKWTVAWSGGGDGPFQAVATFAAGTSGSDNSDYRSNTTYGSDSEAWGTIAVSNSVIALTVRMSNPGASRTSYQLNVDNSTNAWKIYVIVAGTATLIAGPFTQAIATGDAFGLEAIGDVITAYYKAAAGSWASVGSVTDSTAGRPTGVGYIGMYQISSVNHWSNFGGGTVVTAAGGVSGARLMTLGVGW